MVFTLQEENLMKIQKLLSLVLGISILAMSPVCATDKWIDDEAKRIEKFSQGKIGNFEVLHQEDIVQILTEMDLKTLNATLRASKGMYALCATSTIWQAFFNELPSDFQSFMHATADPRSKVRSFYQFSFQSYYQSGKGLTISKLFKNQKKSYTIPIRMVEFFKGKPTTDHPIYSSSVPEYYTKHLGDKEANRRAKQIQKFYEFDLGDRSFILTIFRVPTYGLTSWDFEACLSANFSNFDENETLCFMPVLSKKGEKANLSGNKYAHYDAWALPKGTKGSKGAFFATMQFIETEDPTYIRGIDCSASYSAKKNKREKFDQKIETFKSNSTEMISGKTKFRLVDDYSEYLDADTCYLTQIGLIIMPKD